MDKENILLIHSFFDYRGDQLIKVYKNVKTGEKFCEKVDKPKIPVYVTKEDEDIPDYFKEYRNMDELNEEWVSYKWREYDLARMFPEYDSFKFDVREGMDKKKIYLDKRFFGADTKIEDRAIMNYLDTYKEVDDDGNVNYPDNPPIENLHLGFFDLEWDTTKNKDTQIFHKNNDIYLMTYVDAKTNEVYTYYLKNTDFPRQEEITNDKPAFIESLKSKMVEYFDELSLKSEKKTEQVKNSIFDRLEKMEYTVKCYEKEKDMIEHFYELIFVQQKPDFLYAFNTVADITQTQKRADVLKIDKKKLFTHPEVGNSYNFWTRDNRYDPADRNHNYDTASYTKIMDMILTYFSVRGNKNYTEYNLNSVAQRELGIGKLDYSHLCDHVWELPYADFVTATQYNIIDVLVMVFIEDIIQDTQTIMSKMFITRTDYSRVFVSMPSVMTAFYHMGERKGKVLCNDVNKLLLDLDDKDLKWLKENDRTTYNIAMGIRHGDSIEGGLCTDPNLVALNGTSHFDFNKNQKTHTTVIDDDASSMYPNNTISGNISKSTLVGRLVKVGGLYRTVIDNFKGVGYILEVTKDDWAKIKKKRNKGNPIKKKIYMQRYKAIQKEDYIEAIDGNLYIDLNDILDKFKFGLESILKITDGVMIDRDKYLELKPENLSEKEHESNRVLLQLYIKQITSAVGEKAMLAMIQRDIISIGNLFFDLPDIEELEIELNGIKPNRTIDNTAIESQDRNSVFTKHDGNKELLNILGSIDHTKLNDKDVETGIYKTNGLFLMGDTERCQISTQGRFIEYYLSSGRILTDVFNLDEAHYVNRKGELYDYVYEEQCKPKVKPDINSDSLHCEGILDEDDIDLLKASDNLMRRFKFGDVSLNITARMMPVLKEINEVAVEVYETEHDGVYDVKLSTSVKFVKPIEDTLYVHTYMRILNY